MLATPGDRRRRSNHPDVETPSPKAPTSVLVNPLYASTDYYLVLLVQLVFKLSLPVTRSR